MRLTRFSSGFIFSGIITLLALACGAGQILVPTAAPVSSATPAATRTALPEATPFGGGSVIAFSSNRDGNWEIYTMNSDGSNHNRATNSPATSDWFPKLSPDGTLLLYWSYTDGNPPSTEIRWMQPDGTTGVFGADLSAYTSFSPDGQTVAISVYAGQNNVDIYTVGVAGGQGQQLTSDPGTEWEPAWSPDGKTIAFVSNRDDGVYYVYLMNADGSDQRRLTDRTGVVELEPSWSPDGNEIALVSGAVEAFLPGGPHLDDIYIIHADGLGLRNLTNQSDSYNENPVWSPDGSLIAFWSDRGGDHDIYSMHVDGSGLVNLTNNPADDENPTWSR
jgi:Tol biopolymer transport system component